MSRWWMWLRSACMGLWPWAMRRMKAKAGVKDGQAQHQEGHHKGDDGVELEQALDGHGGQNIAQEGGAGVAHEHLGGVHVVGHEAHAGPHQGRHHHGHLALARRPGR